VLAQAVKTLAGNKRTLVIVPEKESKINVFISAENMNNVKVLLAKYLNIRDLLNFEQLIFDASSLDVIESYLDPGKAKK
jgi:large subunit ribosomal protein L4